MAYTLNGYGDRVLDHYDNPRNAGEVEEPDAVALVENPACGDTLRLSLKIRDGVITQAKFKTHGCGAAIAASSVATTLIEGRRLEDAERLTGREVAEALGGLPPAKLHCSALAEDAVRTALRIYREGGGGRSVPEGGTGPEPAHDGGAPAPPQERDR